MGTSGTTFSLVIPLPIQGQIDALRGKALKTNSKQQKRLHLAKIQKLYSQHAAAISLDNIYGATNNICAKLTNTTVTITDSTKPPSRPDVADIVHLLKRIFPKLCISLSAVQQGYVEDNLNLKLDTTPPTPIVSESDSENEKTLAYLNAILVVVSALSTKSSTTLSIYAPAVPTYIASSVSTAHHLAVLGQMDSIGQAVAIWKGGAGANFARPPQVAGTSEETYFVQYIDAIAAWL